MKACELAERLNQLLLEHPTAVEKPIEVVCQFDYLTGEDLLSGEVGIHYDPRKDTIWISV